MPYVVDFTHTQANYIAIASQWYEGKSATWNDDRFKAIETHFQETEEYPSWQKEPWMLADFPKDAVREWLH